MLPALTTKPKYDIKQVRGLTNDSIDSYSNTGSSFAANINDPPIKAAPPSNYKNGTGGRNAIKKVGGAPLEEENGSVLSKVAKENKATGEEELSKTRIDYLNRQNGYEIASEFQGEQILGTTPSVINTTTTTTAGASSTVKKKKKSNTEELAAAEEATETKTPRKSKKKHKKSNKEPKEAKEDMKISKKSKKRKKSSSKKKRHRRRHSSSSEENSEEEDDEEEERRRKRRHRKHRRSYSSDSDTESDSGSYSDSHRRRRRRHRGRRSDSEDSDYDSRDDKKKSKRRHRHRHSSDSEDEFRSSCKNKDKSVTAATVASNTIEASTVVASSNSTSVEAVIADVQEQVNKLSVSEITSPKTVAATTATVQVEERLNSGTKSDENRSESAIKQSTNASSYSTSSSTTTTSNADSSSNSQNKPQTFGDRMRSFLGGSSQKNVHKQKQQRKANANGILNACPGTVQGEEGWYEHGENERYYFTLNEDKWNLLYGPISEDDFEIYSKKVLDINRSIELPHTYLHKEGYYLNMDMRVKKLS